MTLLKETLAWLRGGTAGLNPVEDRLVSRAMAHLSVEEAQAVRSQLDFISLVQRPQPGRMTIIFYSKTPPLLENRENEICIASVTYKDVKEKKCRVLLMAHHGCIQSIEGRIPTCLGELNDISVSVWPNLQSKTPQAIHRLEHGADDGC